MASLIHPCDMTIKATAAAALLAALGAQPAGEVLNTQKGRCPHSRVLAVANVQPDTHQRTPRWRRGRHFPSRPQPLSPHQADRRPSPPPPLTRTHFRTESPAFRLFQRLMNLILPVRSQASEKQGGTKIPVPHFV